MSVIAGRFTAARCGARVAAAVASPSSRVAATTRPEQLQCRSLRIGATLSPRKATPNRAADSTTTEALKAASATALERLARLEMSARQQHAEALPTTTSLLQTEAASHSSVSENGTNSSMRKKNPYEVFYTSLRRQRGEQVAADMNSLVDDLLESEFCASGSNNKSDSNDVNGESNNNNSDAPFSNIKLSPMSLRRSRPSARPEA